MQLKPLGTNKTEIEFHNQFGQRVRVLFSYQTPVAASILKEDGQHYYTTEEHYSRTTTKHIKSWLPVEDASEEPQAFFDELAAH